MYDWTWIFILPGLLLGLWAQAMVKNAYAKYAKVTSQRGVSAEEVARDILSRSGNGNISVARISGNLTDNFDPRDRVVRLSEGVYGSRSIAAIGIAAHECGHAIQAGSEYGLFVLRTAIVPVVNIGSKLYFPIFMAGMVFSWEPLMNVGVICFALIFLFSLVTLPVEINASQRAVAVLREGGYVSEEEMKGVKAVLNAAAWTYVAAVISSLFQMLRLMMIARRRRD